MKSPTCPRCGGAIHEPNVWSSAWMCGIHGEVLPLQPAKRPSPAALQAVLRVARVPVWLPWPLPVGWLVTGFAYAGDERSGGRACATALSGPAPLGGPGELIVVAEEPGVGLGAWYAGLPGPDPGPGLDFGATPYAKVYARGHPTPLWNVDAGPDRAVFVGEAMGNWLWAVLWPASAALLLLEQVHVRDMRDHDQELDVPYGALSPRLELPALGWGVPMRIDLHCHSNVSDGTQRPSDVVHRAHAADVDVLALTDHDTVAGLDEAAAALPTGLALVPGMELSCLQEGASVHLLGYLFDPADPGLGAETARIRDDRARRARAMVDRLADLGVSVTWEQVQRIAGPKVGGAVGRPHIARAMVEVGAVETVAAAFTPEWIAAGGRAYVGRYALDPVRAVQLIRRAGGVVVLAHPYADRAHPPGDEAVASLAAAGLHGIEVDHPDHGSADRERLRGLARELGLVPTGSSDDHGSLTGHRLGCETTAADAYESLVAQAHGAAVLRRPRASGPGE